MPRIIDEIFENLDKAPYAYSDNELTELGIDPNLFVFLSRPDFSDNTFALWEYIERNTDYKTAWLLLYPEHSAKLDERGIVNAVWNTPEGRALAKTARVYVNNTDITYMNKYPGQIFVNLWHGSGVKALDYIVFNDDNPRLMSIKRVIEDFDLHLVHSHVDKINMAAEYFCDARRFIATGQPRFDRIKSAAGKDNIKKIFDGALSKYNNVILYTPTHRITSAHKDGDFFSSNVFNISDYDEQSLNAFLERFNAALIIKLHPIDGRKFNQDDLRLGANSYLINDDDLFYADLQMNDIINAFDVLIADYSSIVTDFLFLDRPVIYSVGDFDKYSKNKGFVYNDVSLYMPGDKVTNFDGLLGALEDAFTHPERHSEWRRTFIRQKFSFTDDNSCKRALEAIENYKPLTDYGEQYFIKKTLIPIAEKYEKEISEHDELIWDYENRISSAIKVIENASHLDSVMKTALSALSTPSVSRAEQKIRSVKTALESICDNILEGYLGEYVFLSLPQKWGWTGKTRTMIQQFADQTANMGYLFFLGVTNRDSNYKLPVASDFPSAQKATEKLIILDYCHYTETVLERVKRHGKKAIFVVPSNFFDEDEKVVESGTSSAYKTIYFYRYLIDDYRGKKNYSCVNVAQWEALKYACRSEKINFVACNEHLYRFAREESDSKEIFLQTSGVDFDMFSKNGNLSSVPEKLKTIKASGNPIFGYCGTIDARLYFSILHYACGKRKNYQFVFIGPNRLTGSWGHIFEEYSNIHLLDEVDYASMPGIINALDVAIIPYFRTVKERMPSKLFEYFACGKPVVTTDMAIGQKYDNVFMGESHGDFINCLDNALTVKDDATLKARSVAIAEKNDWNLKTREILRWIGL